MNSSCSARVWRTPSRATRCAAWIHSKSCCSPSPAETTSRATNGSATCLKPSLHTTNRVNRKMSSHTAQTSLKLIGKLILDGDLTCHTGLHIGAGKGSLDIGGADNPVVRDA